jgi:hypothetical protein
MNKQTVSAEHYKMLANSLHDNIVAMQAAWIEWKRGKGAEEAMQWIENSLKGPGFIPKAHEDYASEPQAYFDANRAEPMPRCHCGRPSHIGWMGQGFCSEAHYQTARAAAAIGEAA